MKNIELLASAVRKERKAARLTQDELGKLSDTGINFISQLERGKETVRLNKLLSVLNVLGLEISIKRGKNFISIDTKS